MLARKKKDFTIPLTTIGIVSLLIVASIFQPKTADQSSLSPDINQETDLNIVDLPFPNKDSRTSVERALNNRRSYRNFEDEPLSLSNLSQLLWSAQGVTADWGGRTVSSSKSAYPLSLYVISTKVDDLDKGLYLYIPGDIQPAHQLTSIYKADLASILEEVTDQYSLQHAPLVLIITSSTNKIESYLEAGQAAQNMFLQSESLGLGMTTISNFDQDILKETLKIPQEETIIYLIPIGHPNK
jgi:SagB-type dehydrogenase family enzyme